MKYLSYIIFLFLSVPLLSQEETEQDLRRVQLDIHLGWAIPLEANFNSGMSYGLEPKFFLMDIVSIGARADWRNFSTELQDVSYNAFRNLVFTTDFYSTPDRGHRLYVGVGYGWYKVGGRSVFTGSFDGEWHNGIMGRVGYNINQVGIYLDYNYLITDRAFDYMGIIVTYSL